jgi:hypothetical protein
MAWPFSIYEKPVAGVPANDINAAIRHAKNNAAPGVVFTMLIDANISTGAHVIETENFNLTIIGVDSVRRVTADKLEIGNKKASLTLGTNVRFQGDLVLNNNGTLRVFDNAQVTRSVTIDSEASLYLFDTAGITNLTLKANGENNAYINIEGDLYEGTVSNLHLMFYDEFDDNDDIEADDIIKYWEGRQVLNSIIPNPLVSVMNKFTIRDILSAHSSDRWLVHDYKIDGDGNLKNLVLNPKL